MRPVWIAAAGSPSGGSGFLLSLCARRFLRAAASQPVLLEAETNIRDKMASVALSAYHRLLAETPMTLASVPAAAARQAERAIAGAKDEHVLAAALAIEARFLLTLDKPLAQRVNAADLPRIRAYAPGEFITSLLPTHPDYPTLRD